MAASYQKYNSELNETELFSKILIQIINRYHIDEKLASEMAWDLIDVLSGIESDLNIFEKYYLQ